MRVSVTAGTSGSGDVSQGAGTLSLVSGERAKLCDMTDAHGSELRAHFSSLTDRSGENGRRFSALLRRSIVDEGVGGA